MEFHREDIRRLMVASHMLDGVYARMAKKLGIKEMTLTLLYALDDGAPHSQIEICRRWMIPKTTLNTIVMECVQKGTVELVPGEHGKEKQILLTPAGQAAADSLKVLYEMEEKAYRSTMEAHGTAFSQGLYDFAHRLREEERAFAPGAAEEESTMPQLAFPQERDVGQRPFENGKRGNSV